MPVNALTFDRVSKAYSTLASGTKHALRNASFTVPRGRKIAIVGRSGSGKSTLLHLAAGIDVPSEGHVLWGEQDISILSDRERTVRRRDEVGQIFQFFHLLPYLSVRENVSLPELIAGAKPASFDERVLRLLKAVELADRANDPVEKLSGGEMQRVAICRALLRRPQLVLADEPTGNLDDHTGRTVMDLVLQLTDTEGATLLYVTHSVELAALADETWQLRSGELETS